MAHLFRLFFLLCLTLSTFTISNTSITYSDIAQENLKTLTIPDIFDTPEQAKQGNINECDFLQSTLQEQLNPKPEARRRLLFSLLKQHEKNNPHITNNNTHTALDKQTYKDLEILCGPSSNPSSYLSAKLDRTVTEVGRLTLMHKLVNPTADITKLEQQQTCIKKLVEDQELFNKLNTHLKNMMIPENALLSFWQPHDIFSYKIEEARFKLPLENNITLLRTLTDEINKSPELFEIHHKGSRLLWQMANFMLFTSAIALPVYALTGKDPFEQINGLCGRTTTNEHSFFVSKYTLIGVACIILKMLTSERTSKILTQSTAIYTTTSDALDTWKYLEIMFVTRLCIYEKISHVATYIQHLKTIAKLMPKLTHSLTELTKSSEDLSFLLSELETDTFTGDYSNWFSYWGRIFVCYQYTMELKEKLLDAILMVGELDAQLSIAKLYKEYNDKPVRFCFPEYIHTQDHGPSLLLSHFWNPILDPATVVSNSFACGPLYAQPTNSIITGPNAWGKSTITKSIVIAAIMAQSLGIAPAESMTFTPFSKIMTHLHIIDDIAAGNSTFKASATRARDILAMAKELPAHTYGFTAIDELFNGTACAQASAVTNVFIKNLGTYSGNMCIVNTHDQSLSNLEKTTKYFKNYALFSPYRLTAGISTYVHTLNIMHSMGFDQSFLMQAQQLLDQ